MEIEQLLRSFNFEVTLRKSASGVLGEGSLDDVSSSNDLLGTGGFQECTGLQIELDIKELVEGGRNDGVIRRVGRAKYSDIVLKRGMFFPQENPIEPGSAAATGGPMNQDLWNWLQQIAMGTVPVVRYDGIVTISDQNQVKATWSFVKGLPAKIVGPSLNAKTGDIAIEELTISHQGLRLEPPTGAGA